MFKKKNQHQIKNQSENSENKNQPERYQKEKPFFNFVLSPCFRKELNFFDKENYATKKEHFEKQVDQILEIVQNRPELKEHLTEIDTVGDEKELYRKKHFLEW